MKGSVVIIKSKCIDYRNITKINNKSKMKLKSVVGSVV